MGEEEKLREELEQLKEEHRTLDGLIETIAKDSFGQLQLQRLKKRKLWIKDRMLVINSRLCPDIIA